jgi:AcrR family transcriptional regulator
VSTTAPASVPLQDGTRARILAAALALMSERGAAATSMRQLAAACRLNVATIYHHFPSKAALLRAVIDQQAYEQRLAAEHPPLDPAVPAADRLARLLRWLWSETRSERDILRLLVGEGARGDEAAQASTRGLLAALEATLVQWIATGFPELADRGIEPATAARLVRSQLLALVAEHLVTGAPARDDVAASDLATAVFG